MTTASGVPAAIDMAVKIGGLFLRDFARDGEHPDGFWEDPFILGFLSGCALKGAPSFGPELLDLSVLIRVAADALGRLSGEHPDVMEERIRRRVTEKDPEYDRGVNNADKALSALWNRPGFEGDPEIAAIRERSKTLVEQGAFGEIDEERAFRATVIVTLFNDIVVDRLGMEMKGRPD